MGWIISIMLLIIYMGTGMANWHLLLVAVIYAILGAVEDLKLK